MAYTIPSDAHVLGDTGHTADHNNIIDVLTGMGAALNVLDTAYAGGAKGDGVTDDTAAIQAALNAATAGQAVTIPAGTYKTTSVLTIPTGVSLYGPSRTMAYPGGNYGIGGVPIQGAIIQPSGSVTAVIQFASNASVQYGNQALRRITIDGSNISGGTGHGLLADAVAGVTLEDVSVFSCQGDGLHGAGVAGTGGHPPDFWSITRCKFSGNAGWGVSIGGVADTFITDSEATGNAGGGGWNISNCNNLRAVACKAEFNTGGPGYLFTAQAGFGGLLHILSCTAQFNKEDGFRLTGTGTGIYQFLGCASDEDGQNGGGGGGGFAGLKITGFAGTLIGNGFEVRATGSPVVPQYGISADTSNIVKIGGAALSGATAVVHDGGGNTLLQVNGTTYDPVPVFPTPAQLGVLAWGFPPLLAYGGVAAATSGIVYVIRVPLYGTPVTITNIILGVQTAGSSLTSSQNFTGLYDSAGTKLGGSADQTAAWGSTGLKTIALTGGPFTTSSQFGYVVIVTNGTTPPAFARLGGGTLVNVLGILSSSGSGMPFATNGSGATALPASLTYSSNSATSAQPFWVGLS